MNDELLKFSPSWTRAGVNCREAFQAQMVGRKYGAEETLDAWLWFRAGWLALVTSFTGE